MTKGYETGMKITYEPRSKTVMVNFRGRVTMLPDVFGTESEAVNAAESYCRQQGWRPVAPRTAPKVVLRSAW